MSVCSCVCKWQHDWQHKLLMGWLGTRAQMTHCVWCCFTPKCFLYILNMCASQWQKVQEQTQLQWKQIHSAWNHYTPSKKLISLRAAGEQNAHLNSSLKWEVHRDGAYVFFKWQRKWRSLTFPSTKAFLHQEWVQAPPQKFPVQQQQPIIIEYFSLPWQSFTKGKLSPHLSPQLPFWQSCFHIRNH